MFKDSVSETDVDNLSKLEANRLIDMNTELSKCYADRKVLTLSQSAKVNLKSVQEAKLQVSEMQKRKTMT